MDYSTNFAPSGNNAREPLDTRKNHTGGNSKKLPFLNFCDSAETNFGAGDDGLLLRGIQEPDENHVLQGLVGFEYHVRACSAIGLCENVDVFPVVGNR